MKTEKEYVDLIHEKYKEAVEKGWSRYSAEWGVWSAKMNGEIRDRMKRGENLAKVFQLWSAASNLIELEPVNVERRRKQEMDMFNELSAHFAGEGK